MGNCFSCFKVPPPASANNQCTILEHKDETMELQCLYPPNSSQTDPHRMSSELHVNGNKNSVTMASTLNSFGSHNCGSVPTVHSVPLNQSHSRLPRGLCARLPGRSNNVNSNVNQSSENKHREPSENKITALFDKYKDPEEDLILADGIERLCEDLQLSPEEFKVLVFAWKLNAEQMCQFTRQEFVNGLKAMRVDSIRGIQQQLPEIVRELTVNGELFKDLYRFTFRFGLDVSSGQRILPVDMAILLWKLVFTIREPPLLRRWLQFLELKYDIRGIPRDTWNMFLNFAEIIGDDLGSYDDAEAWPSVFDDFVEYENDKMNQNFTKEDRIEHSAN